MYNTIHNPNLLFYIKKFLLIRLHKNTQLFRLVSAIYINNVAGFSPNVSRGLQIPYLSYYTGNPNETFYLNINPTRGPGAEGA